MATHASAQPERDAPGSPEPDGARPADRALTPKPLVRTEVEGEPEPPIDVTRVATRSDCEMSLP